MLEFQSSLHACVSPTDSRAYLSSQLTGKPTMASLLAMCEGSIDGSIKQIMREVRSDKKFHFGDRTTVSRSVFWCNIQGVGSPHDCSDGNGSSLISLRR